MMQNYDINMENVFVRADNRLEKALDFARGANEVLRHSRIFIAWVATGIAAGALEAAFNYTLKRKQFGKQIASFQIIQEKLQRCVGDVQGMIQMIYRVSVLYQRGKASMGQIALTKAYCTRVARQVCQICREVEGGNGILLENHVMKQLLDLEGVHTYEGSYEINSLVAAREITGIAAFK